MMYMPHLLIDPMLKDMLDVPNEPGRLAAVPLIPEHFQAGDGMLAVTTRLEGAGFQLRHYYPERPERFGSLFDEGYTHEFERNGRFLVVCGEQLLVRLGFDGESLTRATGYRSTTCL
jgi:hypothetical protein